jgi:MFS family permease
LIGLAASGQQSFAFITGEIVPMKVRFSSLHLFFVQHTKQYPQYRFSANAVMYVFVIPFAGAGPAVSKAFILYTSVGWRGCYYTMIAVNFASGVLFYFFYHPPTFSEKFRNRSRRQQIQEFDYVGTFLFLGGLILFLLGLSWGGSVYPWKSARVLATMIVGFVTLVAFTLWECFAKLKEPLLPMHLFKNFAWVVACILLGIGASIYYAMAVIWPQMIAVLYTTDGGASMSAGWWACASSLPINIGQIVGGFLATTIGKTRYQCMVVVSLIFRPR